MNNNVLFSIIVPIYNVEKDIPLCLDSILAQTYDDFEVICINDGSKDDSLNVVKSYEKKDSRVKCYSHENHGVSYTRNKGIELAKGDYIWFIDSDDWIDKDACSILSEEIKKNASDIIVFGGNVFMSKDWHEEDEYLDNAFIYFKQNLNTRKAFYEGKSINALMYETGSYPLIWNKVYKKELIVSNDIKYEESLALGEDEAFLFYIYPLAQTISYIPNKLYHYQRNRPSSATDKIVRQYVKRANQNLRMAQIIEGYWRKLELFPEYTYEYLKRYCSLLYDSAMTIRYDRKTYEEYIKNVNDFLGENFIEYLEYSLSSIDTSQVFEHKEYKVGRKIYYIPNRIHSIKEYYECFGLRKTVKRINRWLKKSICRIIKWEYWKEHSTFCRMIYFYYKYIFKGYSDYKKIKKQVGEKTVLVSCAALGTGDIYQVSLLLKEWIERNEVKDYCFLVVGKNEKKVAESLFPQIYEGHIHQIDMSTHERLRKLRTFVGKENIDFYYFCHFDNMSDYLQITWAIQGRHGWNMMDFYRFKGMNLPEDAKLIGPCLADKADEVEILFKKYNLKCGKTVLLAPYATCVDSFPANFWENIVDRLQKKGYTICTNCGKDEIPVVGTQGIFIPYSSIIQFLDKAGAYIGIRSGLSDIISSSKCKKVVFYTEHSMFWPDGVAMDYLSLNDMGLTSGALEFLITQGNSDEIIDEICEAI